MKQIHFFTAATPNYNVITKLRCLCMKKYKDPNYTYVYHILIDCDDIKPYETYFKSLEDDMFKVELLNSTNVKDKINQQENRKMTFAKLLTPTLFPNIDKILWLDADTLVVKEGMEWLFEQQIENYYTLASIDIPIYFFDKIEIEDTKVKNYFNAGVMLLNLKKIREDGLDKQFEQDLLNYPTELYGKYEDQTLFNYRFKQNISLINPVWNNFIFYITEKDKDIYETLYARLGWNKITDSIKDTIIFHWPGQSKPWWQYKDKKEDYIYSKESKKLFSKYFDEFKDNLTL